jgi:hypothetical protein
MTWLGDYAEDFATLNFKFTTAVNGVPTTLSGTPAVSVYKANNITQSTAGITLTADFDSVTGLNNVLIDLSADVFYAVANDYMVVITTGTVGGKSVVGHVVGQFSIENRFMRGTDSAALASVCTEARLAELDAANIPADVDAILTDTGTAGVIVATNNDKTGYALSAAGVDAIWDETMAGHVTADTAGLVMNDLQDAGRLDAIIDTIAADVVNIDGAAMRGTDSAALASVCTETRLAELDAANLPTDVAGVQSDTDDIQTRLPAALVGGRIDANASAISGSAATADRIEAWMNAFLTGTVEEGGGPTTTVFQTDAAEATDDHFKNSIIVFTGGALLGQARRISNYTGATGTVTVDPALTEAPTAGDTWIIFPLIIAGIDSNGRVDVGRVLGTAQTAGDLAALITTVQGDTDDIQTRLPAALVGGRMDSNVGALGGTVQSATDLKDFADAGYDPATNKVQGVVLADTTTTVTNRVTANMDQIAGVAAAATGLSLSADTIINGTASGTPTTTTMVSDIGVTVNDQYNGRIIIFADDTTTAALRDQATDITACTAATNTLTFTALTTAPVSGDTFVIV